MFMRRRPGPRVLRALSSEMRSRIASSAKLATSDDPPYETNGSVMPVSGMTRVTPPMMRNVWKPRMVAMPAAKSFANGRVASTAIRYALPINSMNATSTPIVPTRPSSSPIAENTKSVAAFGIELRAAEPEPGAGDSARSERVPRLDDLEAVVLARSVHGLSQLSTRSRTCPNAW